MANPPNAQSNISKFALYNFKGTPTRYFKVESERPGDKDTTPSRKPSHHILVVDRSGSMYGDIPEVRTTLEKLLTLSEFKDPSLKVSLISYSSMGDVKLHFSKVTVADVMAANSPYVREIRNLQATCMTCISQGLVMAETLVDDTETTAITLHTDGYANDRSPMQEQAAIRAAVAKLKNHPGVFCNTIGYREWCDYNLLASISNALSGACIQARGVKDVYEAVYNTTKLIAGSVAAALELPPNGANYTMFLSCSARKVLGVGGATMLVKGLSPNDDKTVYRLYELSAKDYGALKVPVNGDDAMVAPILAYTRAMISEGELNTAKYAMVATRCEDLLQTHSRALVSSDIAAMAQGVESYLFDRVAFTPTAKYGLPSTGPSVLTVLGYLNNHKGTLLVNLLDLAAGYKRRGIRRIPGTRREDGTVEEPTVRSKVRNTDNDGWVKVNGFELNRNTATVNLLLSQSIDLYKTDGTRVASVAGVLLDDLRSYNNYTLVGDGMLNVRGLTLRTSDQKVINGLEALGVNTFGATAGKPFHLDLAGRPLVDYDLTLGSVDKATVGNLMSLTVLSKILNGMVKGDPSGFTAEQVAELKAHYLTPALYFSPPTTTPYAKLEDALAKGEVDTKLSYKVDFGTPDITSVGKLRSGNEYLQRRFTLTANGKEIEKPTLDYIAVPGVVWGVKKLTARTTLDSVDALSYPIYEGLLGLGKGDELKALLKTVGCVDPDKFLADIRGANSSTYVKEAVKFVDDAIEAVYEVLRPMVFYIGATGLVPDQLSAKTVSADDFVKAYPNAKLSKAEKEEGVFAVTPGGVALTVYVKGEHFSTQN